MAYTGKGSEFYYWLGEITMRFLANRHKSKATNWGVAENCEMFGDLVSPQRVRTELNRKGDPNTRYLTNKFLDHMQRLKDFDEQNGAKAKSGVSDASPDVYMFGMQTA